jgi:hypothetical protein
MDLSNRETADYWYRRAEEVTDPDLHREAVATFKKFRKLALAEERQRLRLQKPGYGVRSMFGWIVTVAVIVLSVILVLSKVFSVVVVCSVFALALVLCVVAAAVTLRVYGHVSEDSMLAMIQTGLKTLVPSTETAPAIRSSPDIGNGESTLLQHQLPREESRQPLDDDPRL